MFLTFYILWQLRDGVEVKPVVFIAYLLLQTLVVGSIV